MCGDEAFHAAAAVAVRRQRPAGQQHFQNAQQLLRILEVLVMRRPVTPDGNRRRSMESLVAAHERLWHLRHPDQEQG